MNEIMIGVFVIYSDVYIVFKCGEMIELIYCEFELLYYLVKYIG